MIDRTAIRNLVNSVYPFELFFELSPDLLCIAGFDGYFKKVNPAVSELLGYTAEELYSRPINYFVYNNDKAVTSKARGAIKRNIPLLNFENRYVTKSGENVWLSWTSMPLEDKEIVFAIAKNITHKKNLEEDRNKALTNLTSVNKELKQLSYSTSHDLRAPVDNMLLIFDLLDFEKINDADTKFLLNILKSSSEGLKKTLNSYVDILREKEALVMLLEDVCFKDILDEVLVSINNLVQSSMATINIDFSEAETILFNKAYLHSIFLNLITNSIKYRRPGAPLVISICTKVQNGIKYLEITDNGRGFDTEKVKDKMFGLYQKFHDHEDSKGIGLYLVYNHITGLGGSIKATSQVEEGATFTISFKKDS